MQIWASSPEQGLGETGLSVPKFRLLRESGALAGIASYYQEDVNLTERGDPEVLHGERISQEFCAVWG